MSGSLTISLGLIANFSLLSTYSLEFCATVLISSLLHSDPEPPYRQTVQESLRETCQEGQGAGVLVYGGRLPAVPEGVLWQDCGGEEEVKVAPKIKDAAASERTGLAAVCGA